MIQTDARGDTWSQKNRPIVGGLFGAV